MNCLPVSNLNQKAIILNFTEMCTGKRPSSPYNKYDGVVFRTGNNNFKNLLHIFPLMTNFRIPKFRYHIKERAEPLGKNNLSETE